MKSRRVPDRVHVVRPPEQDDYTPPTKRKKPSEPVLEKPSKNGETIQIVRMLERISDKLRHSEEERFKLLKELRATQKTIGDLEDKADNSEKAYLSLETKMMTSRDTASTTDMRNSRYEKSLKATEDKIVKAIAGQALIDQRLKDAEEKQEEFDKALAENKSNQLAVVHQIESSNQEKSRLIRKMERLEEMVSDTQDTLRAKAMVLLTDKSAGAKAALQAPAWGKGSPVVENDLGEERSFFERYGNLQTVGMVSMVIAALLIGWTLSQIQQPKTPQFAMMENGGFAQFNLETKSWEPVRGNLNTEAVTPAPISNNIGLSNNGLSDVNGLEAQKLPEPIVVNNIDTPAPVIDTSPAAVLSDVLADAPADVVDYSDDQLLAALNTDPEGLAAKLNNIEPTSTRPAEEVETIDNVEEAQATETKSLSNSRLDFSVTTPVKNFNERAFSRNDEFRARIEGAKPTAPIADRVEPDSALPGAVKTIEAQAFSGNAEAQHDLAAIYTAGHGGVTQNFDTAAFWFKEASFQDIPNAKYNLGVLYHQGLGVEKDLQTALYWYREAAKIGHAEAQYNLGIAHIEGIGTEYDPALAAGFFERAANNGIMEAAYNLGLIFENGLLGKPKPEEALLWYYISANEGNLEAKAAMDQLAASLQIGSEDIGNFVERMQEINQSAKGRRAGPALSGKPLTALETQKAVIAQVQEYLILSGMYNGPADGINGPRTEAAIKTYQTTHNLSTDGQADKNLLNHMVSNTLRVQDAE